jgi:hypothetical protein
MGAIGTTKNLSQLSNSETDLGGTVCRKSARTDLWGSGEATNRSTRSEEARGEWGVIGRSK